MASVENQQQANHYANLVANSIPNPKDAPTRGYKKFRAEVVENRVHSDGNKIRFIPLDLVPLTKGHLKDNPIPMRMTYQDARGVVYTVCGTHNNNFTAEYWSNDTFRKTPPDVQRGEIVHVWQAGSSDNWYWEPLFRDSISSRRKETVVQSVNADKRTGPDSEKHDSTNTYYQEMSSHNKTWTVSTSKADGEFASYIIQINAGQGCVVIQDDLGNLIELNSKEQKIWMMNQCKTKVELIKNNINVFCNEKYTEEVGTDQTSTVKGNRTENVTGNDNVTVKGNQLIKVSGNCNIEVSGTATIKAPTINLDGDVNIKGGLNVSDDSTFAKPVTFLKGGAALKPIGGSGL